jgi:glycyl-tRNA synthetase beta chain
MSRNLLLEIGTEEVPAHVMPGILKELQEKAEKSLQELRLGYASIRTLGTPRRSALIIQGLDEKQADVTSENRGPSLKIAFDADGNPSKAAQGFARGQHVASQDLVQKDGYVYAVVHEEGKAATEILQSLLPELICGLSFPNNMRWADLDFKFIRPIRWLVALFGTEVIPFEVAEVKSGRISRGHRFLSQGDFEIAAADSYEKACEEQFVIVDQKRRKQMIRQQIEEVAREHGGRAEITEDLLEEVVYLVEYPTALCGSFDDKYLKLPPEAVITPMRDHQRYFPVKDAAGKLMPLFITVRNGGKEHLATVQHGNERVLRARLADAQFFFDEDRKLSLEGHIDKLKTVVFQEGLGTLYDKSFRLEALAGRIADALQVSAAEKTQAMRAAKLAKADLVTGMVTEFTELQGVMGREYALLDGEDAEVAQAIDEHYMPRFAGDAMPKTKAGLIVSLADKIDNLVATFSRDLIPTGSQDPFALRRQALGMVNQLIAAQCHLSLAAMTEAAMELLSKKAEASLLQKFISKVQGALDKKARAKMQADVADFIRLRMKNVLADAGIRYDIVDAVIDDVDDIYATSLRAKAVAKALESDKTKAIQAFVRAGNIAKKAKSTAIAPELFTMDEETALYQAYTSAESAVESLIRGEDYTGAIDALEDLVAPIDKFFDGVMVMDKDEKVRNNRLALLKSVDELIKRVADFSKIVLA